MEISRVVGDEFSIDAAPLAQFKLRKAFTLSQNPDGNAYSLQNVPVELHNLCSNAMSHLKRVDYCLWVL